MLLRDRTVAYRPPRYGPGNYQKPSHIQTLKFVNIILLYQPSFLRISSSTNIVRITLQFSNESAEDLSLLILSVQMTPLRPKPLLLQLASFFYI